MPHRKFHTSWQDGSNTFTGDTEWRSSVDGDATCSQWARAHDTLPDRVEQPWVAGGEDIDLGWADGRVHQDRPETDCASHC